MNPSEIERIYTEYSGKVMGYIRSKVRSSADVEDLCSEVFEKVFRKITEYDKTKSALSTWIYTIARNTVIDFYRKFKPGEELDENLSDGAELDEKMLSTETLGELAKALQKLPEQMREIIVLRYYDGMALTEIAEQIGMSYGAVKLRHQNALLRLRQEMEE